MTPTSASPVLKTELVITLDESYPDVLVATDFTCYLFKPDDYTYRRQLYVMSVDDAAKTVTVKFPGAWSGEYLVQLASDNHGRIDSDLLTLSVHGTVTSVSPLIGSKYGGALVTIVGENFSDDPLDNPVWIGETYCWVITTNATQITCRTDLLTDQAVQDEVLTVFLKVSEQAATPYGDDINFAYVEPTTEITDIQAEFDESTFTYKVVVSGSGFDDTTQLFVDGYEQVFDSQDYSSATFTLVDMDAAASTNIQVFTSMGYPEGSEIAHSIDCAPALLAIDPAVGSAGGSMITVTGSGFGTQTTGLNL